MNSASFLPSLDQHGHLRDWREWTPAVARALARADRVEMTDDHWALIELLRNLYAETGETPPMRLFVRLVGSTLGKDKGSSRFLYRLFPEAPIAQLCRYAGLPKPPHCM